MRAGEHRRIEHEHAIALVLGFQDVGEIAEPRAQAHHVALTQRIDRWIGDLAEILAKELADQPRLVADDGKRGVVPHRSDRLLRAFDHGGQDQLHVLQRLPRRDLTPRQLGAIVAGHRIRDAGQVVDRVELADHRGIILRVRDAILDRAIKQHPTAIEVDRDHLSRPQLPLGEDGRFGNDDHAAFGPYDQQSVRRPGIAQRAQRVAVDRADRPASIGHRQRGRAVPRLHDRRQILVHRRMRVGDVALFLPRLRYQHQLGGRGVASRSADRLEHRIQRGGVRCARRDHRLDVLRMVAEGEARHPDLVAEHPVLVAADRVDLAIMRQAAKRLCQPPLREGVGRITLVEDRDPRGEPVILQVGVEDRQRFGEEQPLVDDRPARQRTDVEALDLCRDHLLFDPAAHDVQVLLEFGDGGLVGPALGIAALR